MNTIYNLINRNILIDTNMEIVKKKMEEMSVPVITISREAGSGGRPIAIAIAKKLGNPWKVYNKEIIDEMAKNSSLEKDLIKEVDEKRFSLIEEFIADIFGDHYFNFETYHRNLIRVVTTIGMRGNAIIIGHGANFLLPLALKIRIVCSTGQRIKWLMKYDDLTETGARKRIAKSDEDRKEFMESLFNRDPKDPKNYDMVIQTGEHMSIEHAADIIAFEAHERFKLVS